MTSLDNNRYQIIRTLGSGGFGDTFLAEDTQMPSHRRCVIKQLKPINNNPQVYQLVQERFKREAAILEDLGDNNPQIPRLYAYFTEADQFYLVQELIEGETLTQKVQREGKLSESAVKDILVNILPVLDYVHSKQIVHRDIKPDNIILRNQDGKPVLIDFGAVRETMGTIMTTGGNATSSIVIGTPGFMPSEQAAGRPVYASDLYSLGLTAIYLLTGKKPHELQTDYTTGEVLWHQYANITPTLSMILDKVIQNHSRDRYATAREMLTALQTGVTVQPTILPDNSSQTTTIVAPTTASVNTTSSSAGNPQLAIIVSGVLISISIVVGFILMKSPQPITVTEKTPSSKPSETSQSLATNPVNPQTSVKPSETPQSVIKPPVAPQTPVTPTETPPSVIQKIKPIITPPPPVNITPPPITPQSNDYSWVSQKVVTSGDLVGKSAFELDIIRNSIYARHGRRFRSAELQNFFNSQSWYNPTYSPDSFPDKLLSPLERQNAAYILAYQNRNGLRWVK